MKRGTQATRTKGRLTVVVLVTLSLIIMSGFCLCNAVTVASSKSTYANPFDLPPKIHPIWGIIVGLIAVALLWLRTVSGTPDWNALKPVPERVIEIVDADINNVYVRTDTGKILHCATAAQEECWQEVRAPVTIIERTRRVPLSPRVDPPGNAVSTLGVAYDATAETGVEA